MPRKLSDTQLLILYHAFQSGGVVLPVPTTLKLNEGAIATVLRSLIQRGLVTERAAQGRDITWREDKEGQRTTLVLTDDGFDAMGLRPPAKTKPPKATTTSQGRTKTKRSQPARKTGKVPESPATPPGSKQALLVDLLRREGGATLDELVTATGWQPHTVRGAIAGTLKKKLGLDVTATRIEGRGRVYRIVS